MSPGLAGGFLITEPTGKLKLIVLYTSIYRLLMATHSSIHAGKSHGLRSLVGYSPWGRKESDMTVTSLSLSHVCQLANLTLQTLI